MKKLYLVDVSSMFFRAYYAVRPLSTSKGLPTNAIYGFLSMVVKLIKDIKPDYIAFCFDRPEPSFRKEIYAEYKANRSEMPPDLIPQVPYIKKLTEALGIPIFEQPGFEADDIIGSLAQLSKTHGLEVVIVSGDKDFAQLINEHITMLDTMKEKTFTPDAVVEKWGVKPEQFIDYLAITGDASDNIPGVRGVGPKGAEKLLAEFGTLENIYQNIDQVRNDNVRKKLLESQENAFLSKTLVTITKTMDLVQNMEQLRLQPRNEGRIDQLLEELEFQSFKKNLVVSSAVASEMAMVSSESQALSQFKKSTVATDIEIKEWLKQNKRIMAFLREESVYFANEKEVLVYQGASDTFVVELEDPDREWLGFDLKTLWRKLNINVPLKIVWDGMLEAYVLRAGSVSDFFEVQKMFDAGTALEEQATPEQVMSALVSLRSVLELKLKEAKMDQIVRAIEYPVVDALLAMESKGVLIDKDFLRIESEALNLELKASEKKIFELSGEEFNVASPKQLGQVLFEKLNLPKGKKTKTGFSTNNDILEKLAGEFPICAEVINYREIAKLKSTYVDALPTMINAKTGRVHTQFNQALTTTGRLSSTHPNLQNIPIRTDRGMRIRKAFVAEPGKTLVSADYSQIELRVLAHITQDKNLLKAFADDLDIHSATASEIFEVPLSDINEDLRRKAKAVNFGIAYGQGVYGLAEALNISRSESKDIIDRYFERFPGVKNYMAQTVELVKEKGYVETLLGRRRYIPEIHSKNPALKSFAERAAINAPIQGMSSDLVKMAMIEVKDHFREDMILQVHDELIFEMADDQGIREKTQLIKKLMEGCISLSVPLKVNINIGASWADL